MIRRLLFLLPLILLLIAVEGFLFSSFEPVLNHSIWLERLYVAFIVLAYGSLLFLVLTFRNGLKAGVKSVFYNMVNGSVLAFMLPKIISGLLFCLENILRWLIYGLRSVPKLWDNQTVVSLGENSDWFALVVFGIAVSLFFLLLYGVTFGKYRYQVKEIVIRSKDVPKSFEGYKIVQISDVHSGTFDSIEKVKKGIDLINSQDPDLVLFTGDMVNNLASEIEPFMSAFTSIKSKDGKYSVLGNHDYGDYVNWDSALDKSQNLEQLMAYQAQMGFKMMNNTHSRIEKNGEFINVLGVENWGKPPFPQKGNLELAARNIQHNEFTVLMSHDPSHWDYKVKEHPKDINLTLSGHTHGMQLGIDWLGIKWSPVKYRYRKWAGLYTENDRHLYVNRGFGFLGWPGRLGIWPEVTVIRLERA